MKKKWSVVAFVSPPARQGIGSAAFRRAAAFGVSYPSDWEAWGGEMKAFVR